MIRQNIESIERKILSPFATLSENSKGRDVAETECEIRTVFQRDRDRIVHSKAFRRLMHKTQVFLNPEGDHYRTRLTHTLEVTQISRTIARALCLNEDLTEACSLGHDLGHTPFGHAGERELARLCDSGFTHYEQGLRVVEKLEHGHTGLNLTYEVRDGIVNHAGNNVASTLEGQIVKFADRIAYINHDIDDAVRGDIIKEDDIPYTLRYSLGRSHSERIDTMIKAVISESADKPQIQMQSEVYKATMELRKFMFDAVYSNPIAKGEEGKATQMLCAIWDYYNKNPDQLPLEFLSTTKSEGVQIAVCDYISGMTDRYAVGCYKELFIPKVWANRN